MYCSTQSSKRRKSAAIIRLLECDDGTLQFTQLKRTPRQIPDTIHSMRMRNTKGETCAEYKSTVTVTQGKYSIEVSMASMLSRIARSGSRTFNAGSRVSVTGRSQAGRGKIAVDLQPQEYGGRVSQDVVIPLRGLPP